METKKWYQSTVIWQNIVIIFTAALTLAADPTFHLIAPDVALKIAGFIGTVAGIFGIQKRLTSSSENVKPIQ